MTKICKIFELSLNDDELEQIFIFQGFLYNRRKMLLRLILLKC